MRSHTNTSILRWLSSVVGRSKLWAILLLIVRVFLGGIGVVYALALRSVVDSAIAGQRNVFVAKLALFAGLVLLMVFLQAAARYLDERSRATLEKRFRTHLFSQLLKRDYARITATHTGEWMNRLTSDATVVTNAVTQILPGLCGTLVRMIAALIVLLQLIPEVLYVLLPGGLLMATASLIFRKKLKQYHKAAQQTDGRIRSFMQERLTSLLVIHTYTREDAAVQSTAEQMDALIAIRMRRMRFVNLCHTAINGALLFAQVFGIGLCSWGILEGVMTYGTMSAILHLINQLESPFAGISGYLPQYYAMLASAERLREVENYPLDQEETPLTPTEIHTYYEQQFAAMGLTNAVFSYDDGEPVLQQLSLEIGKGEFVAFTGDSGCGKSTTLKLLLSLYPLTDGHAYLKTDDGSQQVLTARWRGLFAYVPQGNHLLAGTIRETLTFGDPSLMAQEDAIWDSLRLACADGFVAELPAGIDTVLGENGAGLSEGQLQRLAIARALLSHRPILLLDEATSALDGPTEEQLLHNLRSTRHTVLIITHREAALSVCDRRIHFSGAENKGRC